MAVPNSLKTPGVYIDEINAFPNSVVAVETAVPAFIGYTEKAEFGLQSLHNKPVRIESFSEFETLFGKGFTTLYDLVVVQVPTESPINYDFKISNTAYLLKETGGTKFNLYDALKFFYQNGGQSCFIVSIGTYTDQAFASTEPFSNGIKALTKESEPTLLVIPDAVLFEANACYDLQQQLLNHCGEQRNRMAILDIYDGDKGLDNPTDNPVANFRNTIGSDYLSYGAAYYPWLHTTIVQPSEIGHKNLSADGITRLKSICTAAITAMKLDVAKQKVLTDYLNNLIPQTANVPVDLSQADNVLSATIPEYKVVLDQILKKKNLLPPAAAMAGIYSLVDSQRGVWKAPANVAVNSVIAPAVLVDHEQQEDLNAPIQGKAICAIRPFIGLGTMVWGARTLDANSLDWRYINVRRTMIMIEQSIQYATKAYVFEPNVKNTWVTITSMLENFLTSLWKLGALAGDVPTDAFSVSVGLGSTMTANDILDGLMNVEVRVAISHPAEFIVITFQQQQQKA